MPQTGEALLGFTGHCTQYTVLNGVHNDLTRNYYAGISVALGSLFVTFLYVSIKDMTMTSHNMDIPCVPCAAHPPPNILYGNVIVGSKTDTVIGEIDCRNEVLLGISGLQR